VPSSTPSTPRPLVWWDANCQRAWNIKQRIWSQQSAETVRQAAAAELQRVTKRAFAEHVERTKRKLQQGTNSRDWWSLTKNIAGLTPPKVKIAPDVDKIADYFQTKFMNDEIHNSVSVPAEDVHRISTFRIKLGQVKKIIAGLDVNKSVGPDLVSPRVLKECANELAPIILKLFQKIIHEGRFPDQWKEARVTPVFKSGSRDDPRCFRPISVLPTLESTFERCLSKAVVGRINRFVPPCQYGFTPGSSTQDVGIIIADHISNALNEKDEVRVICLDIDGAFDRVPFSGITMQLESIGFAGKALSLLSDYLKNRSFKVVHNGKSSSSRPALAGVPQGGIWSPALFNLYARPILGAFQNCIAIMYADDLTLIQRIPKGSRDASAATISDDFGRLETICQQWRFSFKPSKSAVMTASLRRNVQPLTSVTFSGEIIPDTNIVKIVGFTFDSKCTFGPFVADIAKEGRRRLGALKRMSRFLDQTSMLTFYKAYIRSKLEYGALIYWAAASTHLASIDIVQQRFLSFSKTTLQTLDSRREAAAIGLVCKLLRGPVRGELVRLVPELESSSNRRSARLAPPHHLQLKDQRSSSSLQCFDRSFRGRLPAIWNRHELLRNVDSFETAASMMKALQRHVSVLESRVES
jgi:hypothetical protein